MTGAAELVEVADGVFAYLQEGGWGFSNAGLVRGRGSSLLVDTLYDMHLTRHMLSTMYDATREARIGSVVNTHANGDHCWGNGAVKDARIISSKATAQEMLELKPGLMSTLVNVSRTLQGSRRLQRACEWLARMGVAPVGQLAEAAELVVDAFGPFVFDDVRLRVPDTTFEGTLEVDVGGKRVQLIEVGPAHTRGDVIVYVPSDRVVFSGDILFIKSHPIMWAGPVANWIAACDRILALDADIIVPGHGPLTDKAGVRELRQYWSTLAERTREAREQRVAPADLAWELARDWNWSEPERLAVNIETLYREHDGDHHSPSPLAQLARMSRLARDLRRWSRARESPGSIA